jgi:hypothetical protein
MESAKRNLRKVLPFVIFLVAFFCHTHCRMVVHVSLLGFILLLKATCAVHNFQAAVERQLCFLTAISSNHLHTANGFLRSIQKYYPCAKTYIYDLGLKGYERKLLLKLPYVEDVMELVLPVRGKNYFPSGSCAFKPPMLVQFIDKYRNNETNCRFFFYGDSVIFFHHKFNEKAYQEVLRNGQ